LGAIITINNIYIATIAAAAAAATADA
jgi:hypothetical protein